MFNNKPVELVIKIFNISIHRTVNNSWITLWLQTGYWWYNNNLVWWHLSPCRSFTKCDTNSKVQAQRYNCYNLFALKLFQFVSFLPFRSRRCQESIQSIWSYPARYTLALYSCRPSSLLHRQTWNLPPSTVAVTKFASSRSNEISSTLRNSIRPSTIWNRRWEVTLTLSSGSTMSLSIRSLEGCLRVNLVQRSTLRGRDFDSTRPGQMRSIIKNLREKSGIWRLENTSVVCIPGNPWMKVAEQLQILAGLSMVRDLHEELMPIWTCIDLGKIDLGTIFNVLLHRSMMSEFRFFPSSKIFHIIVVVV